MKFSDLLFGAEMLSITGEADIFGLQYDSRKMQTGDCFVAMKGESTNGNEYIDSAIARGAFAVVTDSPEESAPLARILSALTLKTPASEER